jgi:glycosyltransferase involved in cell wall biosynthesis
VLNGGSTLTACLESIIEQNHESFEIIIIDGGSTDETIKILDKYSSHIRFSISEPDTGIYNAWNKGIRVSKGEWISFLGSDDTFTSRKSLSTLNSIADYPSTNYVSGRMAQVNADGDVIRIVGRPFISSEIGNGMKFSHPGSLHHISLFRDHGFFNESYKIAGDYEFFLRCKDSIRAAYTPEILVNMSIGGLSGTEHYRVISEGYRALRDTPKFGAFKAISFFLIAIIKSVFRRVLTRLLSFFKLWKVKGIIK